MVGRRCRFQNHYAAEYMNDSSKDSAKTPNGRSSGTASVVLRRLTFLLRVLILGAVVFSIYHPAMRAPFIFDDAVTIVETRRSGGFGR